MSIFKERLKFDVRDNKPLRDAVLARLAELQDGIGLYEEIDFDQVGFIYYYPESSRLGWDRKDSYHGYRSKPALQLTLADLYFPEPEPEPEPTIFDEYLKFDVRGNRPLLDAIISRLADVTEGTYLPEAIDRDQVGYIYYSPTFTLLSWDRDSSEGNFLAHTEYLTSTLTDLYPTGVST